LCERRDTCFAASEGRGVRVELRVVTGGNRYRWHFDLVLADEQSIVGKAND
jgi:hypothetical protein